MKIKSFPAFAAITLASAILVGAAIGAVLPRSSMAPDPTPKPNHVSYEQAVFNSCISLGYTSSYCTSQVETMMRREFPAPPADANPSTESLIPATREGPYRTL